MTQRPNTRKVVECTIVAFVLGLVAGMLIALPQMQRLQQRYDEAQQSELQSTNVLRGVIHDQMHDIEVLKAKMEGRPAPQKQPFVPHPPQIVLPPQPPQGTIVLPPQPSPAERSKP